MLTFKFPESFFTNRSQIYSIKATRSDGHSEVLGRMSLSGVIDAEGRFKIRLDEKKMALWAALGIEIVIELSTMQEAAPTGDTTMKIDFKL